jgi:D-arabinose 1-dehydrogenase-like Zn-dependent alcohol dehydrogenase
LGLDELERTITLVEEGRVKTVVDGVKPLEELNEAFDAHQAGDVVGWVVLDVGGVL